MLSVPGCKCWLDRHPPYSLEMVVSEYIQAFPQNLCIPAFTLQFKNLKHALGGMPPFQDTGNPNSHLTHCSSGWIFWGDCVASNLRFCRSTLVNPSSHHQVCYPSSKVPVIGKVPDIPTHYTWLIKGMCQFSVPVTFWSFQGYSPGVRLEPPAGCATPRWVQQKWLGFTACDHRVCWDLEFWHGQHSSLPLSDMVNMFINWCSRFTLPTLITWRFWQLWMV